MDSRGTDRNDELPVADTPRCSVLYSWANLHGAKYRDFSASRREIARSCASRLEQTRDMKEHEGAGRG